MNPQIVTLLKASQDCLSAEELGAGLGMSSQALWQDIQYLRELGYDIVSVPHRGYRLSGVPDRLYPVEILSGLKTSAFGRRVVYHERTASTMDEALVLARGGAAEGTLVVAESQHKGRGRQGRSWDSPHAQGIYASLILRPDIAGDAAATLTQVSAVAICEALNECTGADFRIKWPNDIVSGARDAAPAKLAGILAEMKAEDQCRFFVIVGFGINVNTPAEHLVPGAVSLSGLTGQRWDRARLLCQILQSMEQAYLAFLNNGAAAIVQRSRELSATLGTRVTVSMSGGQVSGEAVDLDVDGGLLVRRESGIVEKVMSGEVISCR